MTKERQPSQEHDSPKVDIDQKKISIGQVIMAFALFVLLVGIIINGVANMRIGIIDLVVVIGLLIVSPSMARIVKQYFSQDK